MIFVFVGCNPSDKHNDSMTAVKSEIGMAELHKGIPPTACQEAESGDFIIFLNEEAVGDSIEGLPDIKQVSLWKYDKKKNAGNKILLTHPQAKGGWFSMDKAVVVPLDSIPTISDVTILSWPGEPLRLLVEGCADYRNVQSFIVEENDGNAICLPTNSGLIGISTEEYLLIMQSYEYYPEGGRYNRIEAFDHKGNRVSSMKAMLQNN